MIPPISEMPVAATMRPTVRPTAGEPPPLPPRRCSNCAFRHDDDGLCHRRGVTNGLYDWQTFTPTPCLEDAACFYHIYRRTA